MKIKHKGRSTNRLKSNPAEAIFASEWEKLNTPSVPDSRTTIDWLLHGHNPHARVRCTQDEATIAATVIQWLGSPVGSSWLTETMGKVQKATK